MKYFPCRATVDETGRVPAGGWFESQALRQNMKIEPRVYKCLTLMYTLALARSNLTDPTSFSAVRLRQPTQGPFGLLRLEQATISKPHFRLTTALTKPKKLYSSTSRAAPKTSRERTRHKSFAPSSPLVVLGCWGVSLSSSPSPRGILPENGTSCAHTSISARQLFEVSPPTPGKQHTPCAHASISAYLAAVLEPAPSGQRLERQGQLSPVGIGLGGFRRSYVRRRLSNAAACAGLPGQACRRCGSNAVTLTRSRGSSHTSIAADGERFLSIVEPGPLLPRRRGVPHRRLCRSSVAVAVAVATGMVAATVATRSRRHQRRNQHRPGRKIREART